MIENRCTAARNALLCDQHDRFRSLGSSGPVVFYEAIGPNLGVVGPGGDAAHEDAIGVTISRVRLRCHHRARPRAGHLTHSELIGGARGLQPRSLHRRGPSGVRQLRLLT